MRAWDSGSRVIDGFEQLCEKFSERKEADERAGGLNNDVLTRRGTLAFSLAALAGAVAPDEANAGLEAIGSLRWLSSPINVRTGVSVYDAESTYSVRFVTYLSRFLLSFDPSCQKWWFQQASKLPRLANTQEVQDIRLKQYAAFAASVEVGLREYRDKDGPARLMDNLLRRYCSNAEASDGDGDPDKQREAKEARRQIALLFGLMKPYQPTDKITKTLAAIDNATLTSIEIINHGTGYAPGYGPPEVIIEPPEADGSSFTAAEGRAVMRPSGAILRVDLAERGLGYRKAPTITISPPANATDPNARAATAYAVIFSPFKDSKNRGRIKRILISDEGSGYSAKEKVSVQISPPDTPVTEGGFQATAKAILELEVDYIEIVSGGSGYAAERPVSVIVAPPPITARVNLMDSTLKGMADADGKVVKQVIEDAAKGIDGTGGGGDCYGRACYDKSVVAVGYTTSVVSSSTAFRSDSDVTKRFQMFGNVGPEKSQIRAQSGGEDAQTPSLPTLGGGQSPTASLLTLFPNGVGLVYDRADKRYVLTAQGALDGGGLVVQGGGQGSSPKPLDPDFGPRGRSPVEREKSLSLDNYLRFLTAGALCCSSVHLAVTPLDVVKTKLQTEPDNYPNPVVAFKKIANNGLSRFFIGWDVTFIGFFVWGGIGYTLTEYLRRAVVVLLDAPSDGSWEIPIVIFSAGFAAAVGSLFLSPFETIRIRMVTGAGGDGNGFLTVGRSIIEKEGIGCLFDAVPAFLLKEIPFAAAKFAVFDYSTTQLYNYFPVAREDLRLSLAVSLLGGCLGGGVAAIASNPADCIIAEMKKSKKGDAAEAQGVAVQKLAVADGSGSDGRLEVLVQEEEQPKDESAEKLSIRGAVDVLYNYSGVSAFWRGISIRIPFYCLVVSLQFLLYDAIRVFLGVGKDDLQLFLDVLGVLDEIPGVSQ